MIFTLWGGRDALSGQHDVLSVAKSGRGYAEARVVPRHGR